MKITALTILLASAILNANASQLADTSKTKTDATLFAPGKIPGNAKGYAAPAFAPDGKSVYFGQSGDKGINIVVS